MPISIANTYQSDYDWKAEADKLKFSDTFIDNSVDESLTTKERILKDANDELDQNAKNDKSIDEEMLPGINKKIENLIPPAGKFDKVVAEKTIAVNAKIRELEILTNAIQAGAASGCGAGTELEPEGDNVSFDVVNAGRNDSEDENYRGVNPFATSVYGANTAMTTGTNPTTIITNNLGIGVTTRIATTGQFLARESKTNRAPSGDPCEEAFPALLGEPYPILVLQAIIVGIELLFASIIALLILLYQENQHLDHQQKMNQYLLRPLQHQAVHKLSFLLFLLRSLKNLQINEMCILPQ